MRAFVVILSLAVATVVSAQAPTTFREGVLAFEKKEWAKAEQLMRQTIAGNPNESEGTVSIAGSWFETYVPHYFLARALAKQGKCAEALVAFAETERQGITPTIPDFARHLQTRGGCKPQPKAEKPKKVLAEVEVPFGEEDVGRASARQDPPQDPPQEPRRAEARPTLRMVDVEARTRLTAAVRAYLEGEYETAARLLGEAKFDDPAAAAEAALFRAAARDALYRIGGEKDDALKRAVQDDLRTYRRLRPNGAPDPRIFPPRFIAMTK